MPSVGMLAAGLAPGMLGAPGAGGRRAQDQQNPMEQLLFQTAAAPLTNGGDNPNAFQQVMQNISGWSDDMKQRFMDFVGQFNPNGGGGSPRGGEVGAGAPPAGGTPPSGGPGGLGQGPNGQGGFGQVGEGGFGGRGQGGFATHTKTNPDGTTETVTTPIGEKPFGSSDPISFDLNGDGETNVVKKEDGSVDTTDDYDVDGDGKKDKGIAKTKEGILYSDKDGNGTLDDGEAKDTKDFESVKKFDTNGDGKIDAEEAKKGNLKLQQFDDNGKPKSVTLEEAGIKEFDIKDKVKANNQKSGNGTIQNKASSEFTKTDGSKGKSFNFDFIHQKPQ